MPNPRANLVLNADMHRAQSREKCLEPVDHSMRWAFLLFVFFTLVVMGCSPFNLRTSLPWSGDDKKLEKPARIVPLWSDTILYETDKPGVRGFAARLYFYPDAGSDPMPVDGSLMVYAFDSDKYDRHQTKPEKKFVFTSEQLQTFHSKTKIGDSYSIWLPWDEVGGVVRKITLITKFKSEEGTVLVSEPARKLLPGLRAEEGNDPSVHEMAGQGPEIRRASHTEIDSKASDSIDLPPSFVRQFGNESPRRTQVSADIPQRSNVGRGSKVAPARHSIGQPNQLVEQNTSLDRNVMRDEATRDDTTQDDALQDDALQDDVLRDAERWRRYQESRERGAIVPNEVTEREAGLPHRRRLEDHFERSIRPARSWPISRPAVGSSASRQRHATQRSFREWTPGSTDRLTSEADLPGSP